MSSTSTAALRARELDAQEYWEKLLPAAIQHADLPWRCAESSAGVGRARVRLTLDPGLGAELRRLCADSQSLLLIFTTVCFAEVLRRFDVAFPVIPVAPSPGEIVLVRAPEGGGATFKEAFSSFKAGLQQALHHGIARLDHVLHSRPTEYRALVCQYGVCFASSPDEVRDRLGVALVLDEAQLALELIFDASAYEPAPMRRLLAQIECLVAHVVAAPHVPLEGHAILPKEERDLILHHFNRPHGEQAPCTVPELIRQQSALRPDAVAIAHGSRTVSYAELDQWARRVSADLSGRAGPKGVIAVVLDRSPELVFAALGTWYAGRVYLPIDPDTPPARVRAIFENAAPAVIVTTEATHLKLAAELESRTVIHVDSWAETVPVVHGEAPVVASGADAAYVIFTSGSTGVPKGALIEHAGMSNHVWAKVRALGLGGSSIVAQTASQCFDISIWQIFGALAVGGQIVIYDDGAVHEPRTLWSDIASRGVTVLELVPSYLAVSLDVLGAHRPKLDKLEWLLVTGETVQRKLLARWFDAYPSTPVMNAYGPTEAADDITHHVMHAAPQSERVPIGRPIPNMNVYVVDSTMRLCPVGVKGEIVTSGVGVGRGYLNDDLLTGAHFCTDPFRADAPRMYRTGDLGRWTPDGDIEFLGRLDQQVKVRGFRVELEEIELHAMAWPGVRAVAIVDSKSDTGNQLWCYVVSERSEVATELKAFLASRLPDYMVPSRIVRLENLPLTNNGKVDRAALRNGGAGISQVVPRELAESSAPNAIEARLQVLWSDILGVAQVQPTDDFFELGGDSLKAIRLAAAYGPALHALDLIHHSVLRELAVHLGREQRDERLLHALTAPEAGVTMNVVAIPNSGGTPLTFRAGAEKLVKTNPSVRLFGTQLPREFLDDAISPLDAIRHLAHRLANEIERDVTGPLVVFGQCNGSAVAMALAEELQSRGRCPRAVVIGAMLPRAKVMHEDDPFRRDHSDSEILKFVRQLGGTLPEDRDDLEFFTRDFRYDAALANAYYDNAVRRFERGELAQLRCPLYCVIGEKDPITRSYRTGVSRWLRHAESVRLLEIAGLGHFLLRDAPDHFARVLDALARGDDSLGTSVARNPVVQLLSSLRSMARVLP